MIILTPFEHALISLEEVLQLPKTSVVRDSAIQRFEYTYELGIKMLKRILEQVESAKASVDELGFKDLIRLGAEKGFIKNPESWFAYRESRNITSHAYDQDKAESIYLILPAFATDARLLFSQLQEVQ
ncbi:TPA: nucleotidyltransferase [Candidatus Uhrbacteria bacterium]|nr:nucleotidyltransferase [Candidatus Uhrbacteria bacterium]